MISVLIVIFHVLAALALILVVLLQVGKGQSIGAAFGGAGSSQTLFGSRGPATFLSRLTAIAAAIFMVTSLSLAYLSAHARQRSAITDQGPALPSAPAPQFPQQPLESAPAPAAPPESAPAPAPSTESAPAPAPSTEQQQQ
jgi:preprotein translocase subunit SecG